MVRKGNYSRCQRRHLVLRQRWADMRTRLQEKGFKQGHHDRLKRQGLGLRQGCGDGGIEKQLTSNHVMGLLAPKLKKRRDE